MRMRMDIVLQNYIDLRITINFVIFNNGYA